MEELQPGQRIGAYRIIRQLGVGGMGRVYEAEHVALSVRRALKVFDTKSEQTEFLRKRFVAEGRILADLQHPRIVRVYDLVVDDDSGLAYFEMDLVLSPNGQPRTLADEQRDGVSEEKVVGWFHDICEGLAYIHSQGVVHRDISLDNILIGPDGHAVITDFGVAKIIDDSYRKKIDVTVTMVFKDGIELRMGKGLYMAPELKKPNGKVTFASDAYAVGVILFRLLSGSWYDVGTHLEDWLADFEYDWHSVIAQLCNEDPEKRLGEGGVAALPTLLKRNAQQPVPFWRQKWARVVLGGVVAVVFAAVALGTIYRVKMKDVPRPAIEYSAAKSAPEMKQRPVSDILKGAEEGKPEDMVLAAELYRDGNGVETNYEKSVNLYRKAIAEGSFDAVDGIGTMYEHGWGVTNNPHAAYLMYLVAAANGVSNSLPNVIRCYENGIGADKNLSEAKRWTRRGIVKPLEIKAKEELDRLDEDQHLVYKDKFKKQVASSKLTQIGGLTYQYGLITNNSVRIYGCEKSDGPKEDGLLPQQGSGLQMGGVNWCLIIPDAIESKAVAEIGSYAFYNATNLVSVALPASIKSVNTAAFRECDNLTKVYLSEGLLEIEDMAFFGCKNLHGVVLPNSVTNIGMMAFSPAPPMILQDHRYFTFKNDALYSKDLSTMFAYYGSNEFFSVEKKTKHIAKGAFAHAHMLKRIVLPEHLETIGHQSFRCCRSLESLIIPPGVTNIGARVFDDCFRLSAVYYQGRIPQVSDDMYDGRDGIFSFVKKNHGWEDPSGSLPKYWPEQARIDNELLNHGSSVGKSCCAIRYWENGKIYSRDELTPMQLELLRAEATRGNVSAMKRLAWKYEHGIDGVKKDIGEAVKYLEGAARGGNDGNAMCKIGDFYRKGINGKKNYSEAVRWYSNALECGGEWSMRACQELANLYRNGLGVEKQKDTAFMLTLVAAAHKMNGAQCVLSDCYEKGIGVETNLVEAARWDSEAEKTCWSGHELGLWYKYGGGVVDKDPKKAFRWFMYGVKQGNGVSAVEIANCYKTGFGVEKDLSKVYEYSMIGARKGWSCGMSGVGECYEKGWGAEKDLGKAAEWYIKAAEADKDYWDGGAALVKAGDCYANGFGVKKDYAKAREWYEKAASRRHSENAKQKIVGLEKRIKREEEERIQNTTGGLLDRYFSLPKNSAKQGGK